MLKSDGKSSIDQKRPRNIVSSSLLLFQLGKEYGPRGKSNKSNKTLPKTPTSPLYPVNNVSHNFLLNEHLTCRYYSKTYKTKTALN